MQPADRADGVTGVDLFRESDDEAAGGRHVQFQLSPAFHGHIRLSHVMRAFAI